MGANAALWLWTLNYSMAYSSRTAATASVTVKRVVTTCCGRDLLAVRCVLWSLDASPVPRVVRCGREMEPRPQRGTEVTHTVLACGPPRSALAWSTRTRQLSNQLAEGGGDTSWKNPGLTHHPNEKSCSPIKNTHFGLLEWEVKFYRVCAIGDLLFQQQILR